MKTIPLTLLGIQVVGIAVLLFGDVCFDKPGRFGLDFDHLLIIATAEVGLLVALAVFSVIKRKWWPALSSITILGIGVALVFAFQ